MKILNYSIDDYYNLENEICEIHTVSNEDLDNEYELVCSRFKNEFSSFKEDEDYEIPEWHNNMRMLWVYIYNEKLYNSNFITKIKEIIDMPNSWFAEFECYSEVLKSEKSPLGSIGFFFLYKETLVFSMDEEWKTYKKKMKV